MNATTVLKHRPASHSMPLLAMALVVMLLGVLLWLLHRNEVEDERSTLIKDILWVEQNIHFHLTGDEEKLGQLAGLLARDEIPPEGFIVQARHLLGSNPEFERLILLDAKGLPAASLPPLDAGSRPAGLAEEAPWAGAFRLARSLGRASYSPPFLVPGRGWVFQVHQPLYRNRAFTGMLVGEVSIEALLTHHVPWWVAEKYKVAVMDAGGTVLGEKSKMASAEHGASHQVRLEPPGQGLVLVATVHRSESNLPRNALATAIFALALSALWSLWAVRSHIHRRLAAEQALNEEHAFRKAMEDSLTVGMRARDLNGRVTYVNPAFCRMVGWSAEELVGLSPPMPYWLPEDMETTMAMHQRVLRGDAPPDGFEICFRRRSGEPFYALVYEAPLIDASGRHTGWMASVLDITERKRAEEISRQQQEQMQRTARLITMGEMASTLAHELNQPLSAIASYNTGCLNRLSSGQFSPGELETAMGKIGVQAQRAGQIIRRIHDFVRKSEPKLQPCSINEVVADAVGFIEADARKHGVTIRLWPAPGMPEVLADRILVEQVILNLARNAIEAMGLAGGSVRLADVSVAAEGGEVVISVADLGPGVAPEVAANLFQPFFTTKEEGMGMGLNICRSIVEFHRGRLWVEANPGGGSVFRFTLPVAARAAA